MFHVTFIYFLSYVSVTKAHVALFKQWRHVVLLMLVIKAYKA